jgi:hypothetical protein
VNGNAPTYATININPEKIRDVIGKGGATIRGICEETKATIDIDDTGLVRIYGETKGATQAALAKVQAITAEVEVGTIYEGKVARIVDFGAFVTIMPGTDGLGAHFPDRQRARGECGRLPEGRPEGEGQGAGYRPARSHQAVHEGTGCRGGTGLRRGYTGPAKLAPDDRKSQESRRLAAFLF